MDLAKSGLSRRLQRPTAATLPSCRCSCRRPVRLIVSGPRLGLAPMELEVIEGYSERVLSLLTALKAEVETQVFVLLPLVYSVTVD